MGMSCYWHLRRMIRGLRIWRFHGSWTYWKRRISHIVMNMLFMKKRVIIWLFHRNVFLIMEKAKKVPRRSFKRLWPWKQSIRWNAGRQDRKAGINCFLFQRVVKTGCPYRGQPLYLDILRRSIQQSCDKGSTDNPDQGKDDTIPSYQFITRRNRSACK